jgi:hypothetical protein
MTQVPIGCGGPLFEVWGKGRIILNRAVTDQSHSNITGLHIYSCFSRTEFICKISPANLNAEGSGIVSKGWVSSAVCACIEGAGKPIHLM